MSGFGQGGGGFGQPPGGGAPPGGGGFGQPPGGAPPGGGGFGQPPGGGAPPGGGGFGQPPGGAPPPGGGGFGPPPSGGGGGFGEPPPSGGGFGTPPPGGGGGGGEGPLAHIPFTPDDEKNLGGMARFARFAGIAAIVAAFLQMVAQILTAALSDLPGSNMAGQVCGGFIGLAIAGTLAMFLFRVSKAVDQVVKTDDADQLNLVEALKALKGYFMVKGIIYIIVIALGCLCFAGMMMFGAAIAGAVGSSM